MVLTPVKWCLCACESSFKFDMIEEEDVLKILQGLDPKWELMG